MNIKEVLEKAIQDINYARNKVTCLLTCCAVLPEDFEMGADIEMDLFHVLENLKRVKEETK